MELYICLVHYADGVLMLIEPQCLSVGDGITISISNGKHVPGHSGMSPGRYTLIKRLNPVNVCINGLNQKIDSFEVRKT